MAAFEKNADAILVIDQNKIITCNEAAVKLNGYRSKADIMSLLPSDMAPEFQPNGQRSSEMAKEQLAIAVKEGYARFKWMVRRPDGSTLPVQMTLLLMQIRGRPLVVSFRQDISALVAARREKHDALVKMADKIETDTAVALQDVRARTAAMSATAADMRASASRTGNSAESAAAASAQALANAQTVASSAEELTASIREIAAQVALSAKIVGRAVAAGDETRATIEALNGQVERIGAVVDIIGEIAAKTNLLALNATIEATRAGEAGKGFAVVAVEVKALATQTARSTREIGEYIGQVRNATGVSVAAVLRIGQTIGEISQIAGSIAAAVEQQGAATAEIARNVSETASAANEVTTRVQEVTAEAESTAKHAIEVHENAGGLNTALSELRQSVIRVVRTATVEVDRRRTLRHRVDLSCRLTVAGDASCMARMHDISEGGAGIHGAPSLPPGTRVTLDIDGVGFALPCVVVGCEAKILRLSFDLDETMAAKIGPFVQRLAPGRAA